jgi:hypothetical protein
MPAPTAHYAAALRHELTARNRIHARNHPHVESYGANPVIVYSPDGNCHGNFYDPAYGAILTHPEWQRRFDKVHAQAARSLPKAERRWRELDSSMSSDALLMNVFCTPGVLEDCALRSILGIDNTAEPIFGWKARVPLANGRFDRTEVDLCLGSLLIEAKLTESDFQTRKASVVESYRDFEAVFDRELLPRTGIATARPRRASEFPENQSQEFESLLCDPQAVVHIDPVVAAPTEAGYAAYQLIRNVLAAHATGANFAVLLDARRPDLLEQWFNVMQAVRSAELRTRLKVLTWQELAVLLPKGLQQFLDVKYGIVVPGKTPTPIDDLAQ